MKELSISQIGNLIEQNWRSIAPLAKRSIAAMKASRQEVAVITEFLAEARVWGGPTANIVKDELTARLEQDKS